jgi:hypothetical protein
MGWKGAGGWYMGKGVVEWGGGFLGVLNFIPITLQSTQRTVKNSFPIPTLTRQPERRARIRRNKQL